MSGRSLHDSLSLCGLTWALNLGCAVGLTEIQLTGAGIADAVAFGITKQRKRGVLIESKTSRADFRRDAKKWHRQYELGRLGYSDFYYIAPPGLISPDELPESWGLLEPDDDGVARIVHRATYTAPDPGWWAHHFATVSRISNSRLLRLECEAQFGGSRITIAGMPDDLAAALTPLKHTTTSGPLYAERFQETP